MKQANATFAKAREMVKELPEPSATYLKYVNERNVKALGPLLVPHLGLQADPAASPERASSVPSAPVFLLHGDEDTVIPGGGVCCARKLFALEGGASPRATEPHHHARRARPLRRSHRRPEDRRVLGGHT